MKLSFGKYDIIISKHPFKLVLCPRKTEEWFHNDYKSFISKAKDNEEWPISDNYPCLDDKNDSAGNSNSTYFQQDLYVAQKIYERNPVKHVDIGSRIDGFVANLASFREIEVIDIRKMESSIKNIVFRQADMMRGDNVPEDYCDSISSLHAIEHFGLGRYGDPIDPEGHVKGFRNITKMLKRGGTFYFSVPLGKQRIEFNAHRVFGMPYLMRLVQKDYDIVSFAYIEDKGLLHVNVALDEKSIRDSFNCNYGCAIFELRKK